jgi:hypothetical protein
MTSATKLPQPIFSDGPEHCPPLLYRDRVNRVLYFAGPFDLSFVGYLEIWQHGFLAGEVGINLVAPVVHPRDGWCVEDRV